MTKPNPQLNEIAAMNSKRIIAAALAERGLVSIRIHFQARASDSYRGLPGYSLVFTATSQKMVERAFDAIEAALKGL